jgi:hypothetical protein
MLIISCGICSSYKGKLRTFLCYEFMLLLNLYIYIYIYIGAVCHYFFWKFNVTVTVDNGFESLAPNSKSGVWRYIVTECLPSKHEALNSTPSMTEQSLKSASPFYSYCAMR